LVILPKRPSSPLVALAAIITRIPPMSEPVPIDRNRAAAANSAAANPAVSGAAAGSQPQDVFRLLVEGIRDYAIFVLDPEGRVLTWNPGAESLKGYTKDEIVGQHFSKFYPAEAVASGWPQRELALAQKEGRFADEGWRVRKDGTTFWASVIISTLRTPDGSLAGFAKVTQDLTERRKVDEHVQTLNQELRERVAQLDESRRLIELRTMELQKLSARLMHVQDEERRRIARELHDDLGQQLAALKMELSKAAAGGASNMPAQELVDSAVASVRNLSYLLHPPLLDEAGLRAALHWYVDGMVQRSKIQITLTIVPPIFSRLPKDIETTIFRIVQESLTNIYKYAGTENARVEIDKQPESVLIRVRDFGRGIAQNVSAQSRTSSLGVGITGMRERVRQFGGELTVTRAEPGTLVEARIPLFSAGSAT
jgi:PAS domain S-box-containing protein